MSASARMGLGLALVLSTLSLSLGEAAARPHYAVQKASGFQLAGNFGANFCVGDGNDDCADIGPSVYGMVAPGWRFTERVSLSLDFQLGLLSNDSNSDVTLSTFSVMPTVRGHFRSGNGEFILGGGLGYDSFTGSSGGDSASWSTFLALKLTAGYAFDLSPGLSLGATLDFFINPSNGEFCVDQGGTTECADVDGGDVAERFTLGLFIVRRF